MLVSSLTKSKKSSIKAYLSYAKKSNIFIWNIESLKFFATPLCIQAISTLALDKICAVSLLWQEEILVFWKLITNNSTTTKSMWKSVVICHPFKIFCPPLAPQIKCSSSATGFRLEFIHSQGSMFSEILSAIAQNKNIVGMQSRLYKFNLS